ncbi:MAG: class I SAM-dependent methyltransferase [Verrucomicrobiales bacterium]|nr:class I SAM-dependent methyltransferase [Verrucomicrobiales bacterium]MCP5556493.1 class I SAM-dependent methyltransferase [Verrucomicrobiaceae bacterium]
MTRYVAVFEVYNPYSFLQLSEVLNEFRLVMNDRVIYSGRAVLVNLVNTGIMLVCEVSLNDDGWIDLDIFAPLHQRGILEQEFAEFLRDTKRIYQVLPEFKVVVADMHVLLSDLHRWMEQVELGVRSLAPAERLGVEREALMKLEASVLTAVEPIMLQFEETAANVTPEQQPVHRSYVKRQIHPLILCSPFTYRTYHKPLGYAGDYEMVSMMLRDPWEGSSMFAKMLNRLFLNTAPVVAHRNRVVYLQDRIHDETVRVAADGGRAQVFNLGCGPAGEVQNYIARDSMCDQTDLLLLDFNEETLNNTRRNLEELKAKHQRQIGLNFQQRSVQQILKESGKSGAGFKVASFDFVYCAGLFDYLSDRICRRLVEVFYDLVAPGGLLVVTNVEASNPSRNWMEYALDWHLVYRDAPGLLKLAPAKAAPQNCVVRADETGVNIFLEVRKPLDGAK